LDDRPLIVACIPAFNEERNIARVVLEAGRYVDRVIVCDDGSMDMTGEIAEALGTLVIRHERNLGKGASLRSLFREARRLGADVVVTIDGDGQHKADEIPRLIDPILRGEADIVNGSRFLWETEMPTYRRIGNKILNFLTNLKTRKKLTDTQSGFRAYSRKALEWIEVTERGIGVDSQILMEASKKGLRIVEVPISVRYEGVASTYNPVRHLMIVVNSIVRKMVEESPSLYLGLPGIISIIAGIMAGVRVVETFLSRHAIAIGTALISVMLIIVGLLLIVAMIVVVSLNMLAERFEGRDEESASDRRCSIAPDPLELCA